MAAASLIDGGYADPAPQKDKEITLDLLRFLVTNRGLSHGIVGFRHLHNLYFLQIWKDSISTLDSLLFCSFIIRRKDEKCKMECFIRKRREDQA